MKTMNTAGGRKRLHNLIKSIREKSANDEIFDLIIRAHTKVNQMNSSALQKFLGELQTLFGCFKKVVFDVSLEATEFLNTRDFFKNKDEGGIFAHVDDAILDWFDSEVKNSPAKELASYEFVKDITEKNIIDNANMFGGIYEEVDLAHIKQICERHIIKGEKLLKEDGFANLFWVRNKRSALCKVDVLLCNSDWYVIVREFNASDGYSAGSRSFFLN